MKPAHRSIFLVSLALTILYCIPSATFFAADAPPAKAAAEPADKPTASETPLVDEKIRQLMQDRKYAEAVVAIDKAAGAENAPKDYLAYLQARALYLQEKYDRAVAAFDALAKQSPEGPWARRARFGKALALARKGDYRSAELIVRAEAKYLLSSDRKQQIADIYLEFADVYFKPPEKENRKPDYKKALEFYNKALDVGPKPEKRVEVELLVAQCQQNLGQHGEAAKLYEKFIEDHAEGPLDTGALEIEARYRLGECRLAEGNHKVARRTWQDLLAKHTDAKSDRIAEATFNLSRTWKIPQPENNEQLNQGTAALEKFIERFPAHKLASQAHLDVARSFIHRGRFENAVSALRRFLADERYKDREEIPEARNLLGRSYQLQKKFDLALATWKDYLVKHPAHNAWSGVQREIINTEYLMGHEKYGEEQYEEAQKLWTAFLVKYPLDARNRTILLRFGTIQHKQKKYDEAIAIWRRLVSKYPKTNESSQAQYLVAATIEKYLAPGDTPGEGEDDTPGATLDEALEEYRKVTWGNHVAAARQAIARLTARSMTVATERVFRSDETPVLKLTTRNIEKVTVRAYKVDMETYFRKMHLARGVEALDISLIDPDVTFEFEVPKYTKYQELENGLEVPLPFGNKTNRDGVAVDKDGVAVDKDGVAVDKDGVAVDKDGVAVELPPQRSGVMAVTVSSKTLETTTLVIQSDLDVIVKSSRDEVFVFAENMLTGKPWPKARLLISNGSKVFAEATTAEDGTFKLNDEARMTNDESPSSSSFEPRSCADVRVFAVAGGHIASNVVDLSGVGVARGLADKGYIYTDRPAYRAGQMVHVRGCLRNVPGRNDEARMTNDEEGNNGAGAADGAGAAVELPPPLPEPGPAEPGAPSEPGDSGVRQSSSTGDVYTIDAGKKYTLDVFDGRNRLLRKEEITLGEFGTFHTHFLLPPTCPQGQYRVLVRDENNGKSYQGSFQVHQYQLEPVRLVIDTPRHVYYRGEQIEGTIRAAYYYGAPLAGREILYRLADQRTHTATTDAKGEVKFKLPTREFSETQVLPLVVTLPQRNLTTAANFVLSSQGFSIAAATVRAVYVAGETFEVTVNAADAEGKPVARKLTLNVLEKTSVRGKVGERLVEKHELQTDAEEGTARQTLKLDDGGRYLIRIEGTDRFDNPISGQHLVRISDDKDDVRLRILADKHTLKVGDTAKVNLHWREEPALALITFQGARILDYQLFALKKGDNRLEIPMSARLAPNFELSVAVMTDSLSRRERAGVRGDVEAPNAAKGPHPNPLPEGEGTKPAKRFHTASSPFAVQRELVVKLDTKRKGGGEGPIRPGEELEVRVTTTDAQGKPVAAEVSLAMVEQSLLGRFASQVPAIEDFFRGNLRQSAVRTTSSITFAYNPSTRPINPRLLAERDRLEVAADEEQSRRGAIAAAGSDAGIVGSIVVDERGLGDGPAGGENTGFALSQLNVDAGTIVLHNGQATVQLGGISRQVNLSAQTLGRNFNRSRGAGQTGAQADFNSLIDLITPTIQPSTWDDVGGPGSIAPFETNLSLIVIQNQQMREQIVVLDGSGNMQAVNLRFGSGQTYKSAEEMAAKLSESGAVLLPGLARQETGYWNPAVTTGDDGKATVTFTVPDRSTAWTLMAKGITAETLAGEATDDLVVKKELFGQLKLPAAFTDGDEAEIVASVHNDAIEKGQIEVTLKITIGDRTTEEKQTLDVTAKGIEELVFKATLKRPAKPADEKAPAAPPEINVAMELIVSAGEKQDVARRSVPLKPDGMPIFATTSGQATSDTTAWVEPPANMPLEYPSLQILIGPTVQQSLLDIVLGPAPLCQIEAARIAAPLETAAADLMASLALQKLLGAARESGGPQAAALDSRVRSGIGLLVSSQNDDGGWSWTGGGLGGSSTATPSQRYGTCRVVWAMSLAKDAGYTVPDDSFNKALDYLRKQVPATANSDYESKAILLHALSTAGQGDFALANRLYRSRPSLSTSALAYLALAFAEMDRDPTAQELLTLLAERNLDTGGGGSSTAIPTERGGSACLPWSHSPTEIRALYALGLQEVSPQAPDLKPLLDWLLAHRTGHRWSPDKATGPAAMALCRRSGLALTADGSTPEELSGQAPTYKLAIFVNDVQVKVLDINRGGGSSTATPTGTQTIEVPASYLTPGDTPDAKLPKQRINFRITGRGRYTYQCILGGFVPSDKLKSTTDDWHVKRTYRPAPLEVDGREIPRGFGVLTGSYSEFKNPLTQLPVGRRGLVELYVSRQNLPSNVPEQRLEYLVVTEPIPSGATVIEKSVRGSFERFEISPGAITFYIGSRRGIGTIRYELYGYLPGKYHVAPTVIRNAHRPDQLVVSKPKSLAVLPSGGQTADKYRLTPQELYELGKLHFGKSDWKTAGGHLSELVKSWNLKPEVYKHSVQMLLDLHLEIGPPAAVVRYFEIIKEKWPAEAIPFDKIVKVGAAYHAMGEYERSYLIFRATVESSFMRESGVAGFLQAQGEFTRSVDVMTRLLREYPPEGYIASATYALAQRVYAKAPEAAEDEKLRKQKINRVDLISQAWRMLEGFLTAYPEDPAADQAAFSTANALLDLEDYGRATTACEQYAKRYADSDLLDSYWYMIGFCHFATSEHQAALEMCRKVAEARRTDKTTGREVEARNKWQAIYILGQVHHSLGEAAKAIAEYRRVEDRFPDAKQSIDYFTRKAIDLPEVTTVKPGEPDDVVTGINVELKFRNIARCDVKVYRIDLMKFSLLKRNLGGITGINLAGIRPYHEAAVELGDGKDYRDRTHKLPLPLKEEGAYLVVCRGEDLHASGLVLVTPLTVEIQEDAASGRVRTTVKDRAADRYLGDVHVKVIGSHNNEFVSGETDLRGVFVADGITGKSTVIARAEGSRYAFFRGKTLLAMAAPEGSAPSAPQSKPGGSKKSPSLKEQLLKGVQDQNKDFQTEQVDQLQEMYDAAPSNSGVEAQKAF